MSKKITKVFPLRLISIVVLFILISVFIVTMFFVSERLGYRNKAVATEGYLDFTKDNAFEDIMYLNGDWAVFDGVVVQNESDIPLLGPANTYTKFPVGSLSDSIRDASYRLYFSIPNDSLDKLTIYIPNFYQSGTFYLNGHQLEFLASDPTWFPYSIMESVVLVDYINTSEQWQELVISGEFSQTDMTLHDRPIVLGTINNVAAIASFRGLNELFLLGVFLFTLISGYIFMLFRPTHKIITLMTIFDTFILLRVILGMKYVFTFIKEVFPWFPITDYSSSTFSIFFLMIGGLIGCKLAASIYDPEGKVPSWLTKPMIWIYGLFAIIFPLYPTFFELYGRYLLYVVYGVTFIGVALQYRVCYLSNNSRVYNFLQFVKTVYIGVIVLFDILTWTSSNHQLLLFYLYAVFFIFHVVVRLYDNNQSYIDVEKLNASLEDTVQLRTEELSTAIRVLSELSIRDSLTQIYNRLHFESEMEQCLENTLNCDRLYLCILDLDFFKRINDTYGHNTGDDQLKDLVKVVTRQISDQVLFARLGGEEFVLLYRGFEEMYVINNLLQIREAIENDTKIHTTHTTASFGVSRFELADTTKQLMKRADLALYEAKRLGRNCVVTNFDNILMKQENSLN